MNPTNSQPPRPRAEIEREADLRRQDSESCNRERRENLSPEQRQLEQERRASIRDELDTIVAKRTPPALAELPRAVLEMDPRAAAREEAKRRKDPSFFGWVPPEKRAAADAHLAQVQALGRRAMELPRDIAEMAPEAAKVQAEKVQQQIWHDYHPTAETREELERELDWLRRRAAGGES